MSRKSAQYSVQDPQSGREARLTKLKSDIRAHFQSVHNCRPLSRSWIRIANALSEVAEVGFMELTIPLEEQNKAPQLGRTTAGTLWDSELGKVCVPIFLEEGKLNLILRMLIEYTDQSLSPGWNDKIKASAAKLKTEELLICKNAQDFERSAGVLIALAISYLEVIKITDLPALLEHIGKTMERAEYPREKFFKASTFSQAFRGPEKLQNIVVFSYMSSIMRHIEDIDAERCLHIIEKEKIFASMIRISAQIHPDNLEFFLQLLDTMNNMFACEEFDDSKEALFQQVDESALKLTLLQLMRAWLKSKKNAKKKDFTAFLSVCKEFGVTPATAETLE